MEDFNGKKFHAVYDYFRVDGARENFKLHISGYYGNAGDAMNSVWENHDGMPFSTKDKDNDGRYVQSGLHGNRLKVTGRFVPFLLLLTLVNLHALYLSNQRFISNNPRVLILQECVFN